MYMSVTSLVYVYGCDTTFIYVHERDTYTYLSTPSRQCQFDTGEPEYTRYTVDKMHNMH